MALQATRIRPCQKLEGHIKWIRGVINLPGKQQIMTCSSDGSQRVWALQSGQQIAVWRDGERGVNAMALSPDEKKVVTGNSDGTMTLWNIDTEKVVATWAGHTRSVESVCWSRDTERVLSGCCDGTARVWDVENGEVVLEIRTGLSVVWAAQYSPDMTMIATAGTSSKEDAFIKIWDANTGKLLCTILNGHSGTVYCLAWGRTLISGSYDKSIRIWNTTTWQQIACLTGHTNLVHDIAISPNGRILASASLDGTARLWNLENPQSIGSPLQLAKPVSCVLFSTDAELLVTGCWDKNAYCWDLAVLTVGKGGPSKLPLNRDDDGKPFLHANATRRPSQPHENAHRLPHGFFDSDSPHPPDSSIRHHTPPSSAHHGLPLRSRFLDWAQSPFLNLPRRRHDELQGHRPMIVDVPLAQNEPRVPSERRAKNIKNSKKNASAGGSRSPQTNVTQQSRGVRQAQPSVLHAPVSTTSAAAPTSTASTSAISHPVAVIRRPGRWTRFRLLVACVSVEYTSALD